MTSTPKKPDQKPTGKDDKGHGQGDSCGCGHQH